MAFSVLPLWVLWRCWHLVEEALDHICDSLGREDFLKGAFEFVSVFADDFVVLSVLSNFDWIHPNAMDRLEQRVRVLAQGSCVDVEVDHQVIAKLTAPNDPPAELALGLFGQQLSLFLQDRKWGGGVCGLLGDGAPKALS